MATSKAITTDRQIAALKPEKARYEAPVSGSRGLCICVYPTGSKIFQLRYVALGGKRRRMPLGAYPGLRLADARERADAFRVGVIDGEDPAAERAAARVAARTGETLDELFNAYQAAAAKGLHGGRGRPKTAKVLAVEESRWRLHIRPRLGACKFTEITRGEIKTFMRELASGDMSPASVASIGGSLRSVLAFAVYEERLDVNPAAGLTRPLETPTRERMFNDDSVAKIWRALASASKPRVRGQERIDKAARLEPSTALALRFALLTLCRRGEVAGAKWAEIDENAGIWAIPSDRAKARRSHVVPLSQPALAVLKEAKALSDSAFLFPAPEDSARQLAPDAMTLALTRLCGRQEIPHGSPHDFRRSGATTLASLYQTPGFIVSLLLGHAASDGAAAITSVYNRWDYAPQQRAALDAWGEHVVALGEGRRPRSADVIPMRRRR